jgi:hypothetical protein
MNAIKDLMTEADTFKKLKEITIVEMFDLFMQENANDGADAKFFIKYGWTMEAI